MAERTAAIAWSVLTLIDEPIFLWNVFPLHPHVHGDPFSNRTHNGREGRVGEDFLANLLEMLKPRRMIAIGNDAARVALHVASSQDVLAVRHPSYGGQSQFLSQVKAAYGV
ncbi:MAG TPA: uracil-DNA glycosylase [Steroidobacteraceae bacterium]|nr:uracil-DNA glycosylase [Steroidobacteraceae bacterium]